METETRLREIIYEKSNIIESMKMQTADMELELRTYKEPIRAYLIELLTNDIDIGKAIRLGVEAEVDNQCMGLKNEILEDLDYKIDEQFDGHAFKSAVDQHLRSKF